MDKAVVVLNIHKENKKVDLEVPLDITANELVIALNKAYNLGINVENVMELHIRSENPIALLKGNTLLRDFGLRNGTIINCF